jgi:acyl homoserine lactone synthase
VAPLLPAPVSALSVLCLNWETAHLHGEAWIAHHRLRHRLFVERQGWDVPTVHGLEHDEFDTPAAQYLLWMDKNAVIRGVTRLLPTTRPYMLKKLWPDLVEGELPDSAAVWEATRFGCDHTLDASTRRRAVAELLCAMQEFGLGQGGREGGLPSDGAGLQAALRPYAYGCRRSHRRSRGA